MKKVPKSFRLFAHTVSVGVIQKKNWNSFIEQITKEKDGGEACVGLFDPATNSIYLLRQPHSQLMHAYLHEMVHAILYYMNHKLYSNEAFVDQLAGIMGQIFDSAE